MGTPTSKSFLAALIAVFAVVLVTPAVSSAQGGSPALTLKASKKQLKPGKKTVLSGNLSGVFSGADGKTITLLASPYPYNSEQEAGTTTTNADGDFEFSGVSPALNTRYRVAFDGDILDGDASSAPVQIFRFPRADYDINVTNNGFVEARLDFFYSDQVQPEYYVGRQDVHWYFRKTTQKTFKQVERSSFFDTDRGVASNVSYQLPLSRKGYRFFFVACVDAPAQDIGFGNDKPLDCPNKIRTRADEGSVRTYAP